ncbi:hypothetical protein [Actinacidiphila glaucinigra]|uniref:hypothetical protein n=1 Tax=Actinacidiphila glaucinigra TaxID=235986 RepID=UPI003713D778
MALIARLSVTSMLAEDTFQPPLMALVPAGQVTVTTLLWLASIDPTGLLTVSGDEAVVNPLEA